MSIVGAIGSKQLQFFFPSGQWPPMQFTSSFAISLAALKDKPSQIHTQQNFKQNRSKKNCMTKKKLSYKEALQNDMTVRENKKTSLRDIFSIANFNLKILSCFFFYCTSDEERIQIFLLYRRKLNGNKSFV